MVAQTLDKKLRDNLRDPRNNMFTGDSLPVAQIRYTYDAGQGREEEMEFLKLTKSCSYISIRFC